MIVRKILKSCMMMGAVVAVFSLLVAGCDKPDEALKRAEDAIQKAKDAGAYEYAADKMESAEQALADGKDQVESYQYQQALESFIEAYNLAMEAYNIALAALKGEEPPPPPPPPTYVPPPPPTVGSHTVVRGDCLWWIAESRDAYSDPFQWPLIYDANRDEIDSAARSSGLPHMRSDGWAHWIFPGQEFDVPMDVSTEDIKNARRRAGAPDPYLPPGR
jgi:nucleoid-associated protein YgaU